VRSTAGATAAEDADSAQAKAALALLSKLRRLTDLLFTIAATTFGVGAFYAIAGMAKNGVINAELLTTALSLACPLITMAQYVAPGPMVVDATLKMNAAGVPTQAIMLQAASNICSIAYGVQIMNSAVLVTNMFGLGCQILFLAAENYIWRVNSGWLYFSVRLSMVLNASVVLFSTVIPLNILGHAITIVTIAMYASPLSKVGSILRTKNASPLPTSMTLISVTNNALWSLFALMIDDSVVLIPSVLGYLLGVFQVLVILWCKDSLPFDLSFLLIACRERQDPVKVACEEDCYSLNTMAKDFHAPLP